MGGKLKEQNREKSPKKDIETEAKREQCSAIDEKSPTPVEIFTDL